MKDRLVNKLQALMTKAKYNKAKVIFFSIVAVAVLGFVVFLFVSSNNEKEEILFEVNGVKITKGTYKMALVEEAISLRYEYHISQKPLEEMTEEEKQEYFEGLQKFWETEIDGRMPFEIVKENAIKQIKAFAYFKIGAEKADIAMSDEERQAMESIVESNLIDQEMVEIDKNNPDKIYLDLFGVTRDEYMDYRATLLINEEFFLRESAKLNVTDSEIEGFFDNNRYFYAKNTVDTIFLSFSDSKGNSISDEDKNAKKQLAEQIKKLIEDGNDFESLVEQYSEADGKEINKGRYIVNRKSVVEKSFGTDFIIWSVNADPGDIEIIETDKGINITRCVEVDGIQDHLTEIKSEIRQVKFNKQVETIINGSEYELKILDEEAFNAIDKVPGSIVY